MDDLLATLDADRSLNNTQKIAVLNGQIFRWEILATGIILPAAKGEELNEHMTQLAKMKAMRDRLLGHVPASKGDQ